MVTVENANKHFPESEETVKGHMNHQRQGVRSTKKKDFQEPDTISEVGKKEGDIYAKVVDLWDPKETIYTDQTGVFLLQPKVELGTSWLWSQLMATPF